MFSLFLQKISANFVPGRGFIFEHILEYRFFEIGCVKNFALVVVVVVVVVFVVIVGVVVIVVGIIVGIETKRNAAGSKKNNKNFFC